MTTITQPSPSPLENSFWKSTLLSFRAMLRRDGFGLIMLFILILFILGPIYSVVLWAFAERWTYPSLIPQQFLRELFTQSLVERPIGRTLVANAAVLGNDGFIRVDDIQ